MPNIKHWFNGLGYLHEFKFDDGELQYSASYVPCTQYEAAMPKSKVGERISTEQDWVPASGAPYVPNTGVTIRMVGDHQVLVNTGYSGSNEAGPGATWLETPFQYTGTPLQPDQGAPAPSHSQTDPDGRVFMFNALFGGASGAGYQLYTVAPGSTEQQQLNILGPNPALGVPTYQHAFSITSNYVVLIEQPCTYGQHGWDTFKWIPEIGTHWRIVRYVSAPAGPLCMRLLTRRLPSRKTGQEVYTLHSAAVFFMHTVNAYETDTGEIVLDVVTYPDSRSRLSWRRRMSPPLLSERHVCSGSCFRSRPTLQWLRRRICLRCRWKSPPSIMPSTTPSSTSSCSWLQCGTALA